jgi:hypothetical protein
LAKEIITVIEVVGWLGSWAVGKLGDTIISALTPSALKRRLSKTIEDWSQALPPERHIEPSAIFATGDLEPGPARRVLFEHLTDSELPTEHEWYLALFERWRAIAEKASPDETQPFFLLPEAEASRELHKLANRLDAVCRGDETMYRNATAGLGRRVRDWQNIDAVMIVNEIIPPQRYSAFYEIGFHLFNGGDSAILISGLRAIVEEMRKVDTFAVNTPGAPLTEYPFKVTLEPVLGSVRLLAQGPRRFTLKPNETEFLRVEITAVAGWEYLIRLGADKMLLHDGSTKAVQTADFWVNFEH